MMPEPIPAEIQPGSQPEAPAPKHWLQRVASVLFVIFCFELGLFLLIYPWTEGWSDNYFAWIAPGAMQQPWHDFWNNTYVRGALSGIGILNLWIALAEVLRMFSGRGEHRSD